MATICCGSQRIDTFQIICHSLLVTIFFRAYDCNKKIYSYRTSFTKILKESWGLKRQPQAKTRHYIARPYIRTSPYNQGIHEILKLDVEFEYDFNIFENGRDGELAGFIFMILENFISLYLPLHTVYYWYGTRVGLRPTLLTSV